MLYTKKTTLFDIDAILSKIGIEAEQKVAELGCGNFGFFVFPLANLVGRRGVVYAVDIIKSALEEIRREAKTENLTQIVPIWSNLETFKATKIETNSLDAALLINILHQSEKKIEIIREAIRLLKRGGKLLIMELKNGDIPFGVAEEKRVKPEAIKRVASKIGLDVIEEFEAGVYHYGLILIKL